MLDIKQLIYILRIVLALQGVEAVEAVIHTIKLSRVIIQGVDNRGYALSDILEVNE